jgi:hypothetical protein
MVFTNLEAQPNLLARIPAGCSHEHLARKTAASRVFPYPTVRICGLQVPNVLHQERTKPHAKSLLVQPNASNSPCFTNQ